ncbi:BLUF domain-containing protein [Rhodopirellula sp. MGV]|uniref:BLUF domain-containing protein n=1 Tax=Rhodopirellula sp. MGV TaxID=2023130 RepID=UPI000B979446|nr:BLUF domain-containing protein [Rhodopirellula sp. MGV]OYP38244.1 hypothetical protein CGZ80_03230 [Rhodopirellula sp. MGV]PNY38581.1 phosphonate transporter [Rhodopirellula baltica]
MPDDRDSELFQLVYVSAATKTFADTELEQLLIGARQTNHAFQITGVLLFVDNTFFQVLEGDCQAVRALYEKIACDPRHSNVLVIAESIVNERNFGDWNMGFIHDKERVASLPGFVDFFSQDEPAGGFTLLQGDSQRVAHILESFRRGRWRRHTEASVT